jgi:L-rhamnose mutarotase
VREYRIFFDAESNHLFAILTRTTNHTMHELPQLDVMRKWWEYMADIMQAAPDHTPLQQPLEPVFRLSSMN